MGRYLHKRQVALVGGRKEPAMSKFTREGTQALQNLAAEVENERKQKGHTPFDDVPESDSGVHSSTREDFEGGGDSLGSLSKPSRAGAIGSASKTSGQS